MDRTSPSSAQMSRNSESALVNKVVASSRGRTTSGGNREDMPPDTSPRGMLANVRARLTRNRSSSSGNEDEKGGSPVLASPAKERKSPRSPRIDDGSTTVVLPPETRKVKSKGDIGAKPVLQARNTSGPAPAVRRREPSEVERKPGWVASLERGKSGTITVAGAQEAVAEAEKEKAASPRDKRQAPTTPPPPLDKKSASTDVIKKVTSSPPPVPLNPAPPAGLLKDKKVSTEKHSEKREIGGPPKKKLPSPRTMDDADTPPVVELDFQDEI